MKKALMLAGILLSLNALSENPVFYNGSNYPITVHYDVCKQMTPDEKNPCTLSTETSKIPPNSAYRNENLDLSPIPPTPEHSYWIPRYLNVLSVDVEIQNNYFTKYYTIPGYFVTSCQVGNQHNGILFTVFKDQQEVLCTPS